MGELVHRAFDGVVESPLAGRLAKPRKMGHTMVIDKGLGLLQTGDLLELAADYIDYWKLTFGTAALYSAASLRTKVALIRSYGLEVYPGGTFFEVAMTQGALEPYLERARAMGFTCIEVSDGTITLTAADRLHAIRRAQALGFTVLTEVGKKESGSELDPGDALLQIRRDLDAGAVKVIVEGRESGKGTGVFDEDGRVKRDHVERIAAGLEEHLGRLMWEAPIKAQQEEMIARFGPNVSLGNIQPDEVFSLEALRRGLRGDTLRLVLQRSEQKEE